MKSNYLVFFFLGFTISVFSQTIRSETYIEGAPVSYGTHIDSENLSEEKMSLLDDFDFEQKLYWRKRYNNEGQEKDSYWFHSAYVKNKMLGVKLIGLDFNFLHERFNNNSWNAFRDENCVRAGASLSLEYSPYYEPFPINEAYKYVNIDIYLNFLHIAKFSKGDKRTRYRKGTWGMQFYRDVRKRKYVVFKVKPLNYVWLNFRYKKNLYQQELYTFLIEWELNANGYNNCKVESTKNIYKGLVVFAGPEYNRTLKMFLLKIGMNFSYRNH